MGSMATKEKAQRVRRSFTDEFKAGAVRLVMDEGKSVGQVARELDRVGLAAVGRAGAG
jgi:transposase